MLRDLKTKPQPTLDDLKKAFGAAADPRTKFVLMTVNLSPSVLGSGTSNEQLKKAKAFLRSSKSSLLKAFNDAGVVCCSSLPSVFLGTIIPEISVWVREQDVANADAVLRGQQWCAAVKANKTTYQIGQGPAHRG